MTINFSKLIGELKKIDAELEILTNNIDEHFTNYIDLSNHCISSLKELHQTTKILNNKNIVEIKENLKHISQTYKKELELPSKNINNEFKQLEKNLNKVSAKFYAINNEKPSNTSSQKSNKSKISFSPRENQSILDLIKQISNNLEAYKKLMDPVGENLNTIKEQTNNIQNTIKVFESSQEVIKLIKSIDDFIKKNPTSECTVNNYNIQLLLEKLTFLTDYLKDLIQIPEKSMKKLVATEENLEIEEMNPQLFLNQFTLPKTPALERSFTDDHSENLNLPSHKSPINSPKNKIDLSIN